MGVKYVADLKGVLIYDGERWETVIHPMRRSPFSLAYGSDHRVYVGYDGDIGYLGILQNGRPGIVSLSPMLPDSMQDIGKVWYTIATPNGIFFADNYRLYCWKPDSSLPGGGAMTTWDFLGDTWLRSIDWVHNRLFILQQAVGLLELKGDSAVAVPAGERLANYLPIGIVPYGDEKILVAGFNFDDDSEWLIYDGSQFKSFSNEITQFSKKYEGYAITELPEERYVLSTLKNGIAIFDRNGRILETLNRQTGLPDNAVQGTYVSTSGSIWVAMNFGLARIDDNDSVECYDHRLGLEGNIMDIVRFAGKLYVATDQGVFRSHPSKLPGAAMKFDRIEGADDWIWSLYPFRNQLLVAGSSGLYQIDPGSLNATTIEDSLYLECLKITPDSLHLLLGTSFDGLRVLKYDHGNWVHESKLSDWLYAIRNITQARDGSYWISYNDAELKRVVLDFSDSRPTITSEQTFGTSSGLPITDYYWPLSVGDHLYVAGLDGLYRFHLDSGRFTPVQLVDEQNQPIDLELSLPKLDVNGNLWLCSSQAPLARADQISPDTFKVRLEYLNGSLHTADAYWFDKDNSIWAGGGSARLIHLLSSQLNYPAPPSPPLINKVMEKDELIYHHLSRTEPSSVQLPYKDNSITFYFSQPYSRDESENEYQYRVVGLDMNWSTWSPQALLNLTHLPVGHFRFEVRGRKMRGAPSEASVFSFSVIPPWYRTSYAFVGYGLLFILFIFVYVRFRINRLINRNRELEQFLEERAKEAVEQYEIAQKAELEAQRLRTANQLAATIAHEFNNPLAVLNGVCDLYNLQDREHQDLDKMTNRIRSQVTRMSGLVDKLMRIEELREIDYAAGFKIYDLHGNRDDEKREEDMDRPE